MEAFSQLALKSECAEAMLVEIGRPEGQRNFNTEACELPLCIRVEVPQEFYSLAYMHAGHLSDKRVGLHSPVCGAAYIIQTYEWTDI